MGPNVSMNRRMNLMSQCEGRASSSASTRSVGIAIWLRVVQEVVEQDLAREHGQERQERGGDGGAEHVPEVRRRAHEHVLDRVREGAATLADPVGDHAQVLFEQDDVGGVLGDIGGGLDRDPDVGGVERDRVIYAVTEKRDVTVDGAVGADQSGLLFGTDASEDRRVDDTGAERVVVERSDLDTGHRACRFRGRGRDRPSRRRSHCRR